MCNGIVPKIAILTFLVSVVAISTLYLTFDHFLEKDIQKTHDKKIKEEFYRLSNYVKKHENQLFLLAYTAFTDKQIEYTFNALNNKVEFDKWASRYTRMTSRLHDLDSLTIWSDDDGLLSSTDHIIGNMTVSLTNYAITHSKHPRSGIIKLGDEIWIVAIAPIMIENFKIGSIQFSRNISNKFKNEVSIESNLKLITLDEVSPEDKVNEERLVLANTIDGKQIYIQTEYFNRDNIERNSTRIYTVIMVVLIALSLFIIFVIVLRKETLPFKILESLFKQFDESTFGTRLTPSCCSEAQTIYKVYNDMLIKLQYVKEKEIMLNQKSKLISIGNLAARVSHDINNPLCVIRSLSDIGRRHGYTTSQVVMGDMAKIYEQTNRCMDISHNLLNISKKISSNLSCVGLNQIVSCYLSEKKSLESSFTYQLIDESDNCSVIISDKTCSHILDILVKNALEANNYKKIIIRLYQTESWGVVEVTDNGVGFPDSSQEEIFDLFFTTKAAGNGVGLSNALSLAHSMDGTIRVTDAHKGQISVYTRLVKKSVEIHG